MTSIITVEGLGKKYTIGHRKQGEYQTLRDTLSHSVKSIYQRLRHPFSPNTEEVDIEEFWALKDINFDVKPGDRLGIIGKNGAGKSTLLKILSRITYPTTGKVQIKGRVASLLEIGTGFHPELTGRENIFLNGAILGMTKNDIKHRFDEIVAFAEIEKFLDTPVKRYSSGMYVRLAFAVAGHLEPEILIIDEVLAVGDAEFQKKCLGKMENVGREGRTVIFVSHNMQAIKQLCNISILLKNGSLIKKDNCDKVISHYLRCLHSVSTSKDTIKKTINSLPTDPILKLIDIKLTQNHQNVLNTIENGYNMEIEVKYKIYQKTSGLRIYFDIVDEYDMLLFRSFHDEDNNHIPIIETNTYISKTFIPANILGPIPYTLKINATIFNVRNIFSISLPIKIENTSKYNRAYLGDTFRGKLALHIPWSTHKS